VGSVGRGRPPWYPPVRRCLLTVVVTTAFLLAAARLLLLSRRLPRSSASAGTNPFRSRAYLLAVLFEVVAIPVAVVLLNRAGYPGAVGSAIVAIVGLHFFGLVPAFKSRRFAAVSGAMVLVGLLSLLLPSVAGGASGVDPRGAATSLGSALVFWVGVLSLVISAWLGPHVRSD
jgi:hypothetical protein